MNEHFFQAERERRSATADAPPTGGVVHGSLTTGGLVIRSADGRLVTAGDGVGAGGAGGVVIMGSVARAVKPSGTTVDA